MYNGTRNLSEMLKKNIGTEEDSWRSRKSLYRSAGPSELQGVADIALCWFAQGHQVSLF